jgi:hypothetical protein
VRGGKTWDLIDRGWGNGPAFEVERGWTGSARGIELVSVA